MRISREDLVNDVFELLTLIGLCVIYVVVYVRPYRKQGKTLRDAPIGDRVLMIARMLVFVTLYSTALLLALQKFAPQNLFVSGRTIVLAAGAVAAVEIVWGPPGDAQWAGAMRAGLMVCKFTLLGFALLLTLYAAYLSVTRG